MLKGLLVFLTASLMTLGIYPHLQPLQSLSEWLAKSVGLIGG